MLEVQQIGSVFTLSIPLQSFLQLLGRKVSWLQLKSDIIGLIVAQSQRARMLAKTHNFWVLAVESEKDSKLPFILREFRESQRIFSHKFEGVD